MINLQNTIKKESLKKVNLKNAKYCHIMRDTINIFFEKTLKNGVKVEWLEVVPNENIKIFQYGSEIKEAWHSLYINDYLVGYLKDILKVDYYPNNQSSNSESEHILVKSILLNTKKGTIKESRIISNGKDVSCPNARLVSSVTKEKNNLLR